MKLANIYISILLTTLFIGFTSCKTTPDKLGTLDLEIWRADRGACKNERVALVKDLKAEQNILIGKSSNEIGELLGRPDIHQLGKRNLKYYVYFLEKGSQCDGDGESSTAPKVIFRFNAVGFLSEVSYQDRVLD